MASAVILVSIIWCESAPEQVSSCYLRGCRTASCIINVFARHQLLVGKELGRKHTILALKPSSITTHGQPNPREMSEKITLDVYVFLHFSIFISDLTFLWVGYSHGLTCRSSVSQLLLYIFSNQIIWKSQTPFFFHPLPQQSGLLDVANAVPHIVFVYVSI